MKICTKCFIEKDLFEFYRPDHCNYCKECLKEYGRMRFEIKDDENGIVRKYKNTKYRSIGERVSRRLKRLHEKQTS